MKTLAMVLMLTAGVLYAAAAQNTAPQPMPGMSMMMNCPMNLKGTTVAAVDTKDGVAVSFTTNTENVAELRQSVERMAAMHASPAMSDAMKQGRMMPATVRYEQIPNGARLLLTPKDPATVIAFRAQVRAHVERMQKGDCSMMQDMMQGMMQGMMNRGGTGANPPVAK
jgi:hypothetical protein